MSNRKLVRSLSITEAEVDKYLKFLSATEPDLRKRIVHLARKNIGQPYEIYLLGEMPFEPYDPQPIYCLTKSDCLVFTEHTYAMALTDNWPAFMRMLQRIRYRDGQLGVAAGHRVDRAVHAAVPDEVEHYAGHHGQVVFCSATCAATCRTVQPSHSDGCRHPCSDRSSSRRTKARR